MIRIEEADPLSQEAVELISALDDFLNRECGAELNHGASAQQLARPNVRFFLARRGEAAVGCAGLEIGSAGFGEVKRMFVAPRARGERIGESLLAAVEGAASAVPIHTLQLETNDRLRAAIRLYERAGYRPRPAFGRYVTNPVNLYFEKALL